MTHPRVNAHTEARRRVIEIRHSTKTGACLNLNFDSHAEAWTQFVN